MKTNCNKPTLADKRQDTNKGTPRFKRYAYAEEDVKQAIKEIIENERLQLLITAPGICKSQRNPDNCSCIRCVRQTFYNLFIEIIKAKTGKELCSE